MEVGFEHLGDIDGVEPFQATEGNAGKEKEKIVVYLPLICMHAKRDSSGA